MRMKKVLSFLLAIVLIVGMLPMGASAASSTNSSMEDFVTYAESFIGMSKGECNDAGLGLTASAWCVDFVARCAKKKGVSELVPTVSSCNVEDFYNALIGVKGNKVLDLSRDTVQRGDILIFKVGKFYRHTGIVTGTTVDGNEKKVIIVHGNWNQSNPRVCGKTDTKVWNGSITGTGSYKGYERALADTEKHQGESETYTYIFIRPAYCDHDWNAVGVCKNCKAEYPLLPVQDMPEGTRKGMYTNSLPIYIYEKPYSGAKKTTLKVLSPIGLVGTVTNAMKETWYATSDGRYLPASARSLLVRTGDIPANITFDMTMPTGTLTKGSSFSISGYVESDGSSIDLVNAYLSKNGEEFKHIYPKDYSFYKNGPYRHIDFGPGKSLDNSFDFKSYDVGSYVIRMEAVSTTGSKVTQDYSFNIVAAAEPTVAAPTIQAENTKNGIRFAISTTTKNARVWYSVNGSDFKPLSSGKTGEYKDAGSYTVKAYATLDSVQTNTISKTVPLEQLAAPKLSAPEYSDEKAYIRVSGYEGTVYYTKDGSTPTTSSRESKGGLIEVDANCTVKVICGGVNGKAVSPVSSQTVSLSAPGKPVLSVAAAKVAVGETVNVTWPAVAGATKYIATLYDSTGTPVNSQTKAQPGAAFKLDAAGDYTVSVSAWNFVGTGEAAVTATISAMPPVTVRFFDWDGTELESKEVSYGSIPKEPETVPARVGHTFRGWDHVVGIKIYEDMDYTAQYIINTYTVKFFDTDEKTQLGKTQYVTYGDAAVAPEGRPPEGYELVGWCVDNKSEGMDYTNVTGNMTLTAAYQWGNKDLPVLLRINSAVYKTSGDDGWYECSVGIKNNDTSFSKGRLVVSVETTAGRTVATHVESIAMPRAENQTEYTDYSFQINSNQGGTVLRAMVLGLDVDNGDKTGGIYSNSVTATIAADLTPGDWGAWSSWSVTEPTIEENIVSETTEGAITIREGATIQVANATQYSYRDKVTTTTTDDATTPSGYTLSDTKTTYGSWSSWGTTKKTASATLQVETRTVAATYKTQYGYTRYTGNLKAAKAAELGYATGKWWYHFCKTWATTNMTNVDPQTIWLDAPLTKVANWSQYCTDHGTYYKYIYNGTEYFALSTGPATRQVETKAAYTEYRSRSITTTRTYWKWDAWSTWKTGTEAPSGHAETKSRVIWRYRTRVLNNGTSPVDASLPEGYEEKSYEGALGLTFDTAKSAAVLVYKRTNTDPTQSQLEYVTNTTIGTDGSYSFTVKPKEVLDAKETGDFIISLAVEGTTRLINADVWAAELPSYHVNFYLNAETQIGETVSVIEGNAAAPTCDIGVPTGFAFVGWNRSISNIREDLDIYAVLEPITCTVTFVDWENSTLTMLKESLGNSVVLPEAPTSGGATFLGWYLPEAEDELFTDGINVTGDMILTAKWEPKVFTVTFHDGEGGIVNTQQVVYGDAAVLPSKEIGVPLGNDNALIFAGWSNDVCWWAVREDLDVYPILLSENTIVAPMASIESGTETAPTYVELSASVNNGKVLYTINEPISSANVSAYLSQYSQTGGDMGEDTQVQSLGFVTMDADEDEEYYANDYEPTILEYNDPILLSESCVIYTFQMAEDGSVSDIASYAYVVTTADEEILVGIGDTNQDGVIDTADIIRLMNYIVGKTDSLDYINADANGDEEISVLDALRLMKYLAGWPVTLG